VRASIALLFTPVPLYAEIVFIHRFDFYLLIKVFNTFLIKNKQKSRIKFVAWLTLQYKKENGLEQLQTQRK
jgi:hypothetical protein